MKERFDLFRRTPAFTGCVLFVVMLVLNILIQGPSSFFSSTNINTLFSKNMPLILVAMAQSLLLITGTLNMSIGISLALVNVVSIMLPQELGMPLALGWICAIFAAMAASALCGGLVAWLGLPAMLASYAMISIVKGANVLIMPTPQGSVPAAIYKTYDMKLLGFIPFSALILVFVWLIWVYLKKTRFGRHIYAAGGSPRNAYAAGISPVKVRMKAYLLSGYIVGLAGLCLTAMTASGNPLQAEDYGIQSLSACIIGGLGFGGWGSMGCAVFGAGFLVLIQNAVYHFFSLLYKLIPGFTVTSYWQNLVSDSIVFLGLLMTIVTARAQRETLRQGGSRQKKAAKTEGGEQHAG